MGSHSFSILSLCSGIGGLDLGLKIAMPTCRTVCYVEVDAYACQLLITRMQEKFLDDAPLWSDLRTFDGKPWHRKVDCIIGGYPCQPFSTAGKRRGTDDPRHLWPEVARIIAEVDPNVCFFENVSAHLRMGFEQVNNDLSKMGYRIKVGVFSANEIGAPHQRERLFIFAYKPGFISSDDIEPTREIQELSEFPRFAVQLDLFEQSLERQCCVMAHTHSCGCGTRKCDADERKVDSTQQRNISKNIEYRNFGGNGFGTGSDNVASPTCFGCRQWENPPRTSSLQSNTQKIADEKIPMWPPVFNDFQLWESVTSDVKPTVQRMADGLADRLEQLRCCGNGVVPLVAAYAFRVLALNIEFIRK